MPEQSNEIECPHCSEVIDISLFSKGELAQKLEIDIEKKLTNQIEQRLSDTNKEALEISKAELRDKLKLEFQNTVEQLNNEVKGNLKMISDLELSKARLEIEKLKKENQLKKIEEDKKLAVSMAVNEALSTEKANNDNVVSEKDLTIQSLQNSIAELQRQSRQGSQQMQGEAGEVLIERILEREFPGDSKRVFRFCFRVYLL